MRKTFWYIIGGQLATISIPAVAQDMDTADTAAPQEEPAPLPADAGDGQLTPDQMAAFDTWPAERQAMYKQWPTDAQAYFWTLPPERQEIFWRLRDDDKLALTAMDDPTRDQAWATIESQLQGSPPPDQSAPPPTETETPGAYDEGTPDDVMDDTAGEMTEPEEVEEEAPEPEGR